MILQIVTRRNLLMPRTPMEFHTKREKDSNGKGKHNPKRIKDNSGLKPDSECPLSKTSLYQL
jgi:hypothetical protein